MILLILLSTLALGLAGFAVGACIQLRGEGCPGGPVNPGQSQPRSNRIAIEKELAHLLTLY